MPTDLGFVAPGDKPALLALTDYELLGNVQSILASLDYKMHIAADHEEFDRLFGTLQYHLVVMEDRFSSPTVAENRSLVMLQHLPMQLRRHAVVALLGDSCETLNTMQAFHQSVHIVVNRADLVNFGRLVLKAISDNDLFLATYRDIQNRLALGQEV